MALPHTNDRLGILFGNLHHRSRTTPALKAIREDLGIDPKSITMAYNSGRVIKNLSDEVRTFGLAKGLLVEDGRDVRLIGPKSALLPCRDALGHVADLYAVDGASKDGQFLMGGRGFFPEYPRNTSGPLFLEPSPIAAAQRLAKDTDQAVLSLVDGAFNAEHLAWLRDHPEVQPIVSERVTVVDLPQLIRQALGHGVELFNTQGGALEKNVEVGETPTLPEKIEPPQVGDTLLDTSDPQCLRLERLPLSFEVLGGVDLQDRAHLKVTLKVSSLANPIASVRDALDLYSHKSCTLFVQQASDRLLVPLDAVRDGVDHLVTCLENYRKQHVNDPEGGRQVVEPTTAEREMATTYLSKDQLMERLQEDLGHIGIVGEQENRMIAFLVGLSRKLPHPLHLVSFGTSGTGKSTLLDAIAASTPEEDVLELTSASEQAFAHMQEHGLAHRVLVLQDMFALSPNVLFQLRELQSKQRLTRTYTTKDKNGQFRTTLTTVQGPVSIMVSTTQRSIYEDNANRSIELLIDESPEQDARVLDRQRALAAGSIDTLAEAHTRARLRNIQRVIRAYPVLVPLAPRLELPPEVFHPRRTNQLLLGLIQAITLLHQYQRDKRTKGDGRTFLISQEADVRWALKLFGNVLLRKSDLLTQATRRFFEQLKAWQLKDKGKGFTQREVAVALRVHPLGVKRGIRELLSYGFVSITGGDRYRGGYRYVINDDQEYEKLVERILGGLSEGKTPHKNKRVSGSTVGQRGMTH